MKVKLRRGTKSQLLGQIGEEFTEENKRYSVAFITDTKELFVLDAGECGDPLRVSGVILKGRALGRNNLEEGEILQAGVLTIGTDGEDYAFDGVLLTFFYSPASGRNTIDFMTHLLPNANIVERL